MEDKWGKRTARLVLHYLMETGSEDLCLAYAQDSDHLTEEAELIQCGEYAEPLDERLERIIADYYEMCSLVLRAIHRLTTSQKRPLAKMEIVGKLQYLLSASPPPAMPIKRRSSMFAEVRPLPAEEDHVLDNHPNTTDSLVDPKRRRLDVEVDPSTSSSNSTMSTVKAPSFSILKTTDPNQNKENVPTKENSTISQNNQSNHRNKTDNGVTFALTVNGGLKPVDQKLLESIPEDNCSNNNLNNIHSQHSLAKESSSDHNTQQRSNPPLPHSPVQTYDPPSDRLSLGAHLSPIPSTSHANTSLTGPSNPMDSICLALLVNEEFQQTLAENINKCMSVAPVAPSAGQSDSVPPESHRGVLDNDRLTDQLEAAVQNIMSLTEKDPLLEDILDCIVGASNNNNNNNPQLPSNTNPNNNLTSDPNKSRFDQSNLNKSIPGSMTSSTPQKKMSLLKAVAQNQTDRKPAAKVGRRRTTIATTREVLKNNQEDNTEDLFNDNQFDNSNQQKPTSRRVLRPRNNKAPLAPSLFQNSRTVREKQQDDLEKERIKAGNLARKQREEMERQQQEVDPVVKVKIIANETFQGATPTIIQYMNTPGRSATVAPPAVDPSNLEYYLVKQPQVINLPAIQLNSTIPSSPGLYSQQQSNTSTTTIPIGHQKLVIKQPAGCHYPMFSTNPIAIPMPVTVEPQVEYMIPLPTPSKDADVDITIGDSLSKLLIPHSTKRFSCPRSDGESGGENETEVQRIEEASTSKKDEKPKITVPSISVTKPVTAATTEKDVSTDKENSVPRLISQTPIPAAIVNHKGKCSSTPRKKHVRALFNTPGKAMMNSPRPSTLAKMDGIEQVTTPVINTDRLDLSKFGGTATISRSAVLTRSASKEKPATDANVAKEALTPRVPKTIKKRILNKLEEVEKRAIPAAKKEPRTETPEKEAEKSLDMSQESMEIRMYSEDEDEVEEGEIVVQPTKAKGKKKAPAKKAPAKKAPAKKPAAKKPPAKKAPTKKEKAAAKPEAKKPKAPPKKKKNASTDKSLEIEAPVVVVAPVEDTRSDLEKWKDTLKASKTGNWEEAVRQQMSQLPAQPREKKAKKCRGKGKKGEKKEGEDSVDAALTEESKENSKVDDSLDVELQKFLTKEGQEDAKACVDTTIEQSTLNDTVMGVVGGVGDQSTADLPNLNGTVPANTSTFGLPNLDESNRQAVTVPSIASEKLPNLNPITPGPVKVVSEAKAITPEVVAKEVLEQEPKVEEIRTSPKESIKILETEKLPESLHTQEQKEPIVAPSSIPSHVNDDHINKAMSPKKRLLQKSRNSEAKLLEQKQKLLDEPSTSGTKNTPVANRKFLEEPSTSKNTPVLARTSSLPPPHVHISPPTTISSHSLNLSKNAANDSLFLETPLKLDMNLVPQTPGFIMPHATPAAKIVKTIIDQRHQVSVLKCSEIPTPDFAITPGVKLTPETVTGSSQAKRPTDYSSSGSSYYKPDDSEENKLIESRLAEELMNRNRANEEAAAAATMSAYKDEEMSQATVSQSLVSEVTSIVEQKEVFVPKSILVKNKRRTPKKTPVKNASDSSSSDSSSSDDENSDTSYSKSSSSSSSSSSESENEMEISQSDLNVSMGRKLIAENGTLDEQSMEIRFSRGKSATPRKPGKQQSIHETVEELRKKMESPKTKSSSQTTGRKALTRLNKDAAIFSDLEEKKRRTAERLKNTSGGRSSPVKKQTPPNAKAKTKPSAAATTTEVSIQPSVGSVPNLPEKIMSSAGKRKTSTPRKVMLISDGPSTDVSTANETTASVPAAGPRNPLNSVQKKYQYHLFGDISDSETDPTPVKKAEKEIFKTPKVEEKFQKVSRISGEKVSVPEKVKEDVNKKAIATSASVTSEAVLENVSAVLTVENKLVKDTPSDRETVKEVSASSKNAEKHSSENPKSSLMGPPEPSTSNKRRLSNPSTPDLKTPEAQVTKKKRLMENVKDISEVPSTTPKTAKGTSRKPAKPVVPKKTAEDKKAVTSTVQGKIPAEEGTTKAKPARKGIIALSELPNEGALKTTGRGTNRKKSSGNLAASKPATIVRQKSEDAIVEETEVAEVTKSAEEPLKKMNFKIPKKKKKEEEVVNDKVEDPVEKSPVVVDRVSKILKSFADKKAQNSPRGNKNTKSTTKIDERKESDVKRKNAEQKSSQDKSTSKKSTKSKAEKEVQEKEQSKPVDDEVSPLETPDSLQKIAKKTEKKAKEVAQETEVEMEQETPVEVIPEVLPTLMEDSGSEISVDYQMVSFDDKSSNYYHFVYDPSEVRSSSTQGQGSKFDPKKCELRIAMGDGYFDLTVSGTEIFSLPGSNSSSSSGTVKVDKKKNRVAGSSTPTASPKITLPKMDPRTVSSVLDFLHPNRE